MQPLQDYIRQAREQGQTDEQIRQSFLAAGWNAAPVGKDHKRTRLIVLNSLSIVLILFVIVTDHIDSNRPDAGLGFVVFAPILWGIWFWTFFEDMLSVYWWTVRRLGLFKY
jgi:hypothetical protein